MDNRINQMNLKKPRGMVGSPYQVVSPSFNPPIVNSCNQCHPYPPFPPQPPMPPQINITVNDDDCDCDPAKQNLIDTAQNKDIDKLEASVSGINSSLAKFEERFNGLVTDDDLNAVKNIANNALDLTTEITNNVNNLTEEVTDIHNDFETVKQHVNDFDSELSSLVKDVGDFGVTI